MDFCPIVTLIFGIFHWNFAFSKLLKKWDFFWIFKHCGGEDLSSIISRTNFTTIIKTNGSGLRSKSNFKSMFSIVFVIFLNLQTHKISFAQKKYKKDFHFALEIIRKISSTKFIKKCQKWSIGRVKQCYQACQLDTVFENPQKSRIQHLHFHVLFHEFF